MVLTAGSTERNVVSGVEDNLGLGEDSVVLDFCLSDGGAVVGEDDELGLTGSEGSEGALVAKSVLSTLDDEAELAVDVIGSDFLGHWVYGDNKMNIKLIKNNQHLYHSVNNRKTPPRPTFFILTESTPHLSIYQKKYPPFYSTSIAAQIELRTDPSNAVDRLVRRPFYFSYSLFFLQTIQQNTAFFTSHC